MVDILFDGHGNVVVIIDYTVIISAAVVSAFGSGWLLHIAYLRARK